MTTEEVLADMRAEVANPPWCYDDSDQSFQYIPVESVKRWIAALTAPQPLELPTHEGCWWEWLFIPGLTPINNQWIARDVEWKDGEWKWWGDGEWIPCKPGLWTPCTQPPPPKGTN